MKSIDPQRILNAIQRKYRIIYTNLTRYNQIYYADIGIDLGKTHHFIDAVYASGADYQKELAILKALVEVVERLVFVSPYVGPIDFIDSMAYVTGMNDQMVPLSRVSPYFSDKDKFKSKGLACHPEKELAIHLSRLEYYEHVILNHLNLDYLVYISPINLTKMNQRLQQSISFEMSLIYFQQIVYCALWHASQPTFILGSACSDSPNTACQKAFIEANGKWEKIEKNLSLLSEIADDELRESIQPGFYTLDVECGEPIVITRHHDILSELQLPMIQSL